MSLLKLGSPDLGECPACGRKLFPAAYIIRDGHRCHLECFAPSERAAPRAPTRPSRRGPRQPNVAASRSLDPRPSAPDRWSRDASTVGSRIARRGARSATTVVDEAVVEQAQRDRMTDRGDDLVESPELERSLGLRWGIVLDSMGRPAELTPELAERIVGYLRDGASLKDASRACGYHESTVRLWRRKGEQPRAREPYVSFSEALTRARREGKLALVGQIRTAAQHDWRAAAWLLERMHPAEFAKRTIPPASRRHDRPASVEFPEQAAEAAHEFLRRVRSNGS